MNKITHPAIRSRHEKMVHEMEGILIDISQARFGTTIDKNTIDRSVAKMQALLNELRVENQKLLDVAANVPKLRTMISDLRSERDAAVILKSKILLDLRKEIAELKRRQGSLL
jgi:hypothetical protein